MIYILFSADYELFLGKNNLPEEQVLIDPSNELMSACESVGVPCNFFADLACFWRYRQLGLDGFPDAVEEQLRDAVRRGHDVQTHLHPSWLYAEKAGQVWEVPPETYSLGSLYPASCREHSRELLTRSSEYLESLLQPVKPEYRTVAFRAGGYALQPQEGPVIGALTDAGYVIDSSVVPGLVIDTEYHGVDFRQAPRGGNWKMSPDSGLAKNPSGALWEIPIAARRETFPDVFSRLLSKVLPSGNRGNRPSSNPFERGYPVGRQEAGANPKARRENTVIRLKRRILSRLTPMHFELELSTRLNEMCQLTEKYARDHAAPGSDLFFSMICHPKSVFQPELDTLIDYAEWVRSKWGEKAGFTTFLEAARLIDRR